MDNEEVQLSKPWYAENAFIVSAVFIAFIILLVGFIVIPDKSGNKKEDGIESATSDNAKPSEDSSNSSSNSTPSNTGSNNTDSSQSTSSPNDDITSEDPTFYDRISKIPDNTHWELYKGLAVPTMPGSPKTTDKNGIPDSFERSPEGALTAATQIVFKGAFVNQPIALVEKYAAKSVKEDAVNNATKRFIKNGNLYKCKGFKFVSYSQDKAVIKIAIERPDIPLLSTTMVVIWEDNDWRMYYDPENEEEFVETIPSLYGYIPWPGLN